MAVDRAGPVRERSALLGQPRRLIVALLLDEGDEPVGQIQRLLAVVGQLEGEEKIGPAHDAETDAAVGLDGGVDLRQRIGIHLDDVVEEAHGEANDALELLPVD